MNPLIALCGLLQLGGGLLAFWTGDWKLAIINACVGVANLVLSTVTAT